MKNENKKNTRYVKNDLIESIYDFIRSFLTDYI